LVFLVGCGSSGGSSGSIQPPNIFTCGLDGFEVLWWVEYDGSLNFNNHSATTHHMPDEYYINETFVVEWNCSVDYSIDSQNHKYIKTFEDQGGWELIETETLDPECVCVP
jgi:hypothetical protein